MYHSVFVEGPQGCLIVHPPGEDILDCGVQAWVEARRPLTWVPGHYHVVKEDGRLRSNRTGPETTPGPVANVVWELGLRPLPVVNAGMVTCLHCHAAQRVGELSGGSFSVSEEAIDWVSWHAQSAHRGLLSERPEFIYGTDWTFA